MKIIFFLFVSNICFMLSHANIISRNSLTGHLNNNGLTSTVIKTQQLSGVSSSPSNLENPSFGNGNNGKNQDNGHFRLFYKSNSPGRSIKHQMEHTFYKNPNILNQQQIRPQSPQNRFNGFFNSLNNIQPVQPVQPVNQQANYASVFGNAQYDPNNNGRTTMFNLHYHDGGSSDDSSSSNNNNYNNQLLRLQQQQQFKMKQQQQLEQYQQMQQQQQARKNNLMKMMLMNFASSSSQQSQNSNDNNYQKPQTNSNGLQYKIVNLKFKIEPQQGKFVGQGIVGTNNGAGNVLNSKHFNLFPNELPALIQNILNTAQQHTNNMNKNYAAAAPSLSQGQSQGFFFKKKRQDIDDVDNLSSSSIDDNSVLDKRDVSSLLSDLENENDNESSDDSQRNRRSMEDNNENEQENTEEDESARRKKRSDGDEIDESENATENDNDFQESFKSLQRRDDGMEFDDDNNNEEDDSELDTERQTRNYEDLERDEEEAEVPLNEREDIDNDDQGVSSFANEDSNY